MPDTALKRAVEERYRRLCERVARDPAPSTRLTRVHDRARVATILVERDRIRGFDSRMISTCDQLRLDSG